MDNQQQFGAAAGGMAGDIGNEADHTIQMSPELLEYIKSRTNPGNSGLINPFGADNGRPEGISNSLIDPDTMKSNSDNSSPEIQSPPPVAAAPHGIFNALKSGYNKPDQSYSSDFLKQLVNKPTSELAPVPNATRVPNADMNDESEEPSVKNVNPNNAKPKEPTTLNFGSGELGSVDALKEAQGKADANRKQANLFAGLDLITAGLNHASPVAQQMYAQQLKDAGIPVDQYVQQVEMQKHDPNSPISKGFRDYLGTFGMNVQGDFTAADADKLMPNILKAYEADATRTAQKENLAYKYNELQTLAGIKSDQKASEKEGKDSEKQDKSYSELRNKLETFRGNQAAQQASRDVLSADKALQLVKGKDPNSLSTQDLRLLSEEMGKIATGGVPTEHGSASLLPNSYRQKLAEIQNFLANKPTDAQAGEYIKHNIKYLEDMKNVAQGTLDTFRQNIAKGYKNRIKPEDYQEALTDYNLNQQNRDTQSAASPSLANYGQQMGLGSNIQAPPSPQALSAQIQQAKAHGYSDQEIQQFLAKKHGQ